MRLSMLTTLALTGGLSVAAAQTQQPPVFRTGVDVLAVDVSVVDRSGRPIDDLGAAEFTVKVDGEVRRIVSLDYISFQRGRPGAERVEEPSPYYSSNEGSSAGRLIAIVVDQQHLRVGLGLALAEQLEALLDALTPSDRVALVTIPSPGPSVDFTTRHELIREALGQIVGRGSPMRSAFNMGLAEALAFERGLDPAGQASVVSRECEEFAPGSMARERCADQVEVEALQIVQEARERSTRSLSALRALVRAFGAIDGPKTVLFVSEGLVVEGRDEEVSDIGALSATAHVTIHVLLLDRPSIDLTQRLAPQSAFRDRTLHTDGLETLAGLARGALIRDVGAGAAAFQRLQLEMSGYYLLGVEPAPGDRDGRRHSISVDVARQGAVVRSRREFRFDETNAAGTGDPIADVLRAPISAGDIPMRVTSYAFQDQDDAKVRVILSAEIGPLAPSQTTLTVGYTLTDSDGRVIASHAEPLVPADDPDPSQPARYSTALLMEPGVYGLKLAAVDDAGARGSVEHTVQAWRMAGEELAVADLILANAPSGRTDALLPGVVVRADSGQLAAYTELYSAEPATLQEIEVTVEIGQTEESPALATGLADIRPGDRAGRASAQLVLPVGSLPPGEYVARAIIRRGDRIVGKLARPLVVPAALSADAAAGAGGDATAAAGGSLFSLQPGTFRPEDALAPEVVGFFLDVLAKGRPSAAALDAPLAVARQGRFDGTALQALEAGDELAAAFLRGLELFAEGQLNPAANQFLSATRLDPQFVPAAFYLGACYVAAGRDREALGLWQRTVSTPPAHGAAVPAALFGHAADLWHRIGDLPKAIEVLEAGLSDWPDDQALRRRLGLAQYASGRFDEALAALTPYLGGASGDQDALVAAVQSLYEIHRAGRTAGTLEEDRALAARLARAYADTRGPHAELVSRWAKFVADN